MTKLARLSILFIAIYASCGCFAQVGINTVMPLSTLDVNGNLSVKVVNLLGNGTGSGTTSTSVLLDDGIYISILPMATDDKFELPNPTLVPGRMYIIRNISNSTTAQLITTTGLLFPKNSTIGSTAIYMYEGNLRTVTVFSDGLNWTYIN